MLPCVPFSNGSTKVGKPGSLSIDSKDTGDTNIRMARERKIKREKNGMGCQKRASRVTWEFQIRACRGFDRVNRWGEKGRQEGQ